jgi:hypothetical protein
VTRSLLITSGPAEASRMKRRPGSRDNPIATKHDFQVESARPLARLRRRLGLPASARPLIFSRPSSLRLR